MINDRVVQVVEVLERTTQGFTRPYLCRGDDDLLYYAKGRGAGRKSLVAEWFASSLAKAFGLPVAPFFVGEVDQALIDVSPHTMADLGAGYVFLSRRVEGVIELTWPTIAEILPQTRRDILVFDWWVRNQDRTLSELGGNPNLLWTPSTKSLTVIDHNQAFDETFDDDTFLTAHVFAKAWNAIYEDMFERRHYEDRLRRAFDSFDSICDKMPESWLWVGDDVPLAFGEASARTTLSTCLDNFWGGR